MKKRIITWLVAKYNKRAKEEDRIEVLKPVVFAVSSTSKIDTTLYKSDDEIKFLDNMIGEKKYDLRQELINQINQSGFIQEENESNGQEIIIKLSIKAFSYGKS